MDARRKHSAHLIRGKASKTDTAGHSRCDDSHLQNLGSFPGSERPF